MKLMTSVVSVSLPPPPVYLCSLLLHFLPFYCFLTPPSAPLPPVQSYYNNRTSLPPSSASRGVPPSSGPRPVAPTHVYQAGSQMMMIPGQQLPFPSSPQGPAYFIPGQVGQVQTHVALSPFSVKIHLNSDLYHLISFLSTVQQPMWPHPSSTLSKQAPPASTQAPALQNMVLMVRGSVQALHSFTSFISH